MRAAHSRAETALLENGSGCSPSPTMSSQNTFREALEYIKSLPVKRKKPEKYDQSMTLVKAHLQDLLDMRTSTATAKELLEALCHVFPHLHCPRIFAILISMVDVAPSRVGMDLPRIPEAAAEKESETELNNGQNKRSRTEMPAHHALDKEESARSYNIALKAHTRSRTLKTLRDLIRRLGKGELKLARSRWPTARLNTDRVNRRTSGLIRIQIPLRDKCSAPRQFPTEPARQLRDRAHVRSFPDRYRQSRVLLRQL